MGRWDELVGDAQPSGAGPVAGTAAPLAGELRWEFDLASDRRAAPELCASLHVALAAAPEALTVVCDVSRVGTPTLAAVSTLARLRLTARRLGRGFRLHGAQPRLVSMIELMGLADVLDAGTAPMPAGPAAGGSGFQVGREAEQGEQLVGVEEMVDPDDPAR